MIVLQTKRLASYDPETRAKRVFLLLPSAWLPYRATGTQSVCLRHHNKVTDPHVTSFTQQVVLWVLLIFEGDLPLGARETSALVFFLLMDAKISSPLG